MNTEEKKPPQTEEVPDTFPTWFGAVGRFLIELVEVVVISLAIILPIRYFLVQPFYVKGASMEPTFDDREYLIIDEISYRFREPARGEVVVFRFPIDPSQYFIKRVIGLPGETVRVSNNVITVVNAEHPEGWILNESYLDPNTRTHSETSLTLGPDEYFVMGDNRSASLDSRSFGALTKKHIVGRVWIRGWPVDRLTVFPAKPVLQ
jgi:signal peptidase I